MVYAAVGCGGPDQLWLYDFRTKDLWFVDFLGAFGDPTYHVVEDRLVYIDENQQAVYVQVRL